MGKLAMVVVVAGLVWMAAPARGGQDVRESGVADEVRRDLEVTLDLWRDGRFGELYERIVPRGRQGKESFVKRLAAAPRRPACCWEKLRVDEVALKDPATVMVRARVGLEGSGGTEFVTRRFKVVRMGDHWRLDQSDVVSLAGGGKKRRSYRTRRTRSSSQSATFY